MMLAVGLGPIGYYGVALVCRWTVSASGLDEEPARQELCDQEAGIRALAKNKRFEEALTWTETLLGRTDLNATERGVLMILRGRLLKESGESCNATFREVLPVSIPGRLRAWDHEWVYKIGMDRFESQISVARLHAGDIELDRPVGLNSDGYYDWERVERNIMDVEPNFLHHAAMELSGCYEEISDWKGAYNWALMAKERFPFDSFCGNAIEQAHEVVEDRLVETAARAGIPYVREPWDVDVWARRRYGPPDGECWRGIGAGLVLAAWGIIIMVRRRLNSVGSSGLPVFRPCRLPFRSFVTSRARQVPGRTAGSSPGR